MNQRRTLHPVNECLARKAGSLGFGDEADLVPQTTIPLSLLGWSGGWGPAGLIEFGLANLQEVLVQVNILPVQTVASPDAGP